LLETMVVSYPCEEEAMALSPQKVGIEQQINASTLGAQVLARFTHSVAPAQLASLPNGVVAVYESSTGGVHMRLAYSDGTLSPEVFVDGAFNASIAALANGIIMVVFDEDSGGSAGNILARWYNADLTLGYPSPLIGIARGYHPNAWRLIFRSRVFAPSIVSLNNGGFFALVWHDSRIFWRRTRLRCRFLHPPTLDNPMLSDPWKVWDLKSASAQYKFNTTNQSAPLGHGGFVYVKRNDDGSLSIGVFNMQDQRTDETQLNVKGTFRV
jgi:hypothetical protein